MINKNVSAKGRTRYSVRIYVRDENGANRLKQVGTFSSLREAQTSEAIAIAERDGLLDGDGNTTKDTRTYRSIRAQLAKRGDAEKGENRKLTEARRDAIIDKCENRCAYCGSVPVGNAPFFEIDHVVPRAKGGGDNDDNLVASCHRCNRVKSALGMEEFRKRMGGGLFFLEIVPDAA